MSTARLLYRNRINAWAFRAISRPVSYDGHLYQADADSRAIIAGWAAHIASGGVLPDGFVWRTADNQDVALTPADVAALNAAFLASANDVRGISWAAKQQLDALDDLDAAEALVAGIGA